MKPFFRPLLAAGLLASQVAFAPLTLSADYDPEQRQEVRVLIDELVKEQVSSREKLEALFLQAEKRQDVQELMSRPAERVLAWHEYRKIFITLQRIQAGKEFMQEYAEALQRAEATYGVEPEIITAIIGVETFYGRNKGRHRVLDALATLSFDYPEAASRDRSSFFRRQLVEFLKLTHRQGLNPALPMGSYAGAMGYPQFIPTSYRDFAVDFDDDGFIDIWTNPVDAIGSVANYFKEHGWQHQQPVLHEAQLEGSAEALADLRRNRFDRLPFEQVIAAGFKPTQALDLPAKERVLPMALALKDGERYLLGRNNFYVITRYNHSRMYALAVHELASALHN